MATKAQNARQPYGLPDELVDSLLNGSTTHEEVFGEDGIYRQLTKRLFDDIRADEGELFHRHAKLHPRLTYPIVVKGDSMINAGLHNDDVVFVDCSLEACDGDIVLVSLNGERTIKRLRVRTQSSGQRVELVAENIRYQPITVGGSDDFEVLGVVAGHYRRLR